VDDDKRNVLNHLLVVLFKNILQIEEKALKTGQFKNLTIGELHVIEAIGIDRTSPMSAIAAKLDITVGTLTISMNNLVRKGYVNRTRSDEDRRVVLIALTDLGEKAYYHHEAFHKEMIGFTLNSLSEEESDVLVRALSKITRYFNEKYE
jgi:DNA-binding MarR family transcriptional regulator